MLGGTPLTKKADRRGSVADQTADRAITPHTWAKNETSAEGKNDKFATVMARIRYSDLDELKEKALDSKVRLSAIRVHKNGCLLRITCVSEGTVDW